MISLSPSPILLIGLAIVVALVLAYAGALYLARRERDALARARREIGEALKAPGIDLSEVPAELRAFEHQMNQLSAERFELEQKNGALERRLRQFDIGPDAKRAAAVSDCMLDVAAAAERLARLDPDFELVGRSMELTAGLQKAAEALKVIGASRPFATQLGELLEQGDLDAALTASAIFEKYFAERTSWRELRVGLRAVDALVVALLDRAGVQVVDVPVLSIVDSGEVRGMELSDRRGLRAIPAIQQKAARIARELRHNEVLVVDCHKPGWMSDRLGSRAPQLAIFDPASWT
ncbi:hypothetical protein [Bradyrhizobium aeschynomenes]|uniref:hypothetical protein n=1 Tax=Bradyrhizobium aeschynomenes TaxID=2734909 RepID=UPI00155786A6|nr:hypothetical protein [Bradyrhizobium aeschynomenes]NPV19284.1 hypothetical protein [Bradyrhizobium aeschynomenes]